MLKILKQKKPNNINPKIDEITTPRQAHFLGFKRENPRNKKVKRGIKTIINKNICANAITPIEIILPTIISQAAIFVLIGRDDSGVIC